MKFFLFFCFLLFSGRALADETAWPTLQNLKDVNAENVYDRPYSFMENKVDKTILYRNSVALVGFGVGTMAFLYSMPSGFTNWDNDDHRNPAQKWWRNVSRGPVWDKDDLFLNYVTHPYAGAIYYMGARSAGANAGYSFLYSFALSTFFWECGIEAFAERPSIQDLIVTPVFGSILGEGFYLAKRSILDNNGALWGSTTLGTTALFLMDPMTEITTRLFPKRAAEDSRFSFSSQPIISRNHSLGYGLRMTVAF